MNWVLLVGWARQIAGNTSYQSTAHLYQWRGGHCPPLFSKPYSFFLAEQGRIQSHVMDMTLPSR